MTTHVIAAVPDLMDRSRLRADGVEVTVVPVGHLAAAVTGAERADLVVVDLSRPGAIEAAVDLGVPVVGFAPHVDDALLAAARTAGIEALPRSVFFRRWPHELVAGPRAPGRDEGGPSGPPSPSARG